MIPTLALGQAGRFGTEASAAPAPLDAYTAGLWAALGITKLLASYAGSAIRVRRSSDNAEQDIGFSGSALDTAALATFIGASSAYVVTWYDQSGASNDFTQATAADQPRIANAGTYEGSIRFGVSGTDGLLAVNNGGSSTDTKSIFRKVTCRARNLYAFPFEYGDGSQIGGGGGGQLQLNDGTSGNAGYIGATGAAYSTTSWAANGPDVSGGVFDTRAHIFKRGLSPGYSGMDLYAAGAQQTRSGGADSGTPASGNHVALKWRLGKRTDGNPAQIDMRTCVIYDTDKSADALAINTALA